MSQQRLKSTKPLKPKIFEYELQEAIKRTHDKSEIKKKLRNNKFENLFKLAWTLQLNPSLSASRDHILDIISTKLVTKEGKILAGMELSA